MALEGMAASLAAARATEGEIDGIAKLSKQHLAAWPDINKLITTDEAFHEAISAPVTRVTCRDVSHADSPAHRVAPTNFSRHGVPTRSGTEHDNVVNFLKRRDSAGARTAMMTHLLGLTTTFRRPTIGMDQSSRHICRHSWALRTNRSGTTPDPGADKWQTQHCDVKILWTTAPTGVFQ